MTGPHTEEGGHYFNEGLAWPILDEPEDEPESEGLSAGFAAAFALIAALCLCAAGYFLTA
jgi:hypothetical protein